MRYCISLIDGASESELTCTCAHRYEHGDLPDARNPPAKLAVARAMIQDGTGLALVFPARPIRAVGAPYQPRSDSSHTAVVISWLMGWIRLRLARVAASWLVLHLALVISVPTTLCCTAAGSAITIECACDHSRGQMCPMHRTPAPSHRPGDSHACSCRSTSDPMAAMTAALIGPPAIVTRSVAVADPLTLSAAVIRTTSQRPYWTHAPDSPPPRF